MKIIQRTIFSGVVALFAILFLHAQGITIGSGTTVTLGSSTLSLPGNWSNSGTFTAGSGTVIFNGPSGTQTITNASGETFNNLTVNNASGNVQLANNIAVNGTLTFLSGTLTLGANNLTTSTISGATSSSYVVTNSTGYLIQSIPNTSTHITFPVGTSSAYNPVILYNSGTTDNYSVRVASSAANVVTAAGVVLDQWTINEASSSGTKNVGMTLQWNGTDEGATFASSRTSGQIGQYSGSGTNWTLFPTAVGGGNPYTAAFTGGYSVTTSFSNSIYSVGLNGALPVELTSFTAASLNAETELVWGTATEVNNYGFEVQRKTVSSSQSPVTSWGKIGFVPGSGTSNAPHSYSLTDNVGSAGTYSYRLKQIDHNGAFTYSQETQVTIEAPKVLGLSQNYPNPFNPSTNIQFTVPTDGRVVLKVYNALGQEVATLFDGVATAGQYNQATFDALRLASGMYFSRLEFGGKMELKKMLLLK